MRLVTRQVAPLVVPKMNIGVPVTMFTKYSEGIGITRVCVNFDLKHVCLKLIQYARDQELDLDEHLAQLSCLY